MFLRSKAILLLPLLMSFFMDGKPNIIIILTDDLGWGDVSYHGGSIPTPNIDKLANEGVLMLEQHVVSPVCTL